MYKDVIHKGWQSILFVPRDVHDPLPTLVNVIIYARGVYRETLVSTRKSIIYYTFVSPKWHQSCKLVQLIRLNITK